MLYVKQIQLFSWLTLHLSVVKYHFIYIYVLVLYYQGLILLLRTDNIISRNKMVYKFKLTNKILGNLRKNLTLLRIFALMFYLWHFMRGLRLDVRIKLYWETEMTHSWNYIVSFKFYFLVYLFVYSNLALGINLKW